MELLQLVLCWQLDLVDVDVDVSQELPIEESPELPVLFLEESPELPVLFLDLVSKRPLTPSPPP